MTASRWPVQPQRPYQHGQIREGIAITTKPFPLDWMLLLVRPAIFLDGYPLPPSGWGRSVVATTPGEHHLHVHVPYFWPQRLGPADAIVDVAPGHGVQGTGLGVQPGLARRRASASQWGRHPDRRRRDHRDGGDLVVPDRPVTAPR